MGRVETVAFTFVRIPLIFGCLALAYLAFRAAGSPSALGLALSTSTIAVTLTNVVNLALLRRVVHRSGGRLRDLIGYDRTRIGRDIAWGLCWWFVLGVPFFAAVSLLVLVLFWLGVGAGDLQSAYVSTFVGVYGEVTAMPLPSWLLLVVGVVFPFLNAPTEELHYRAFAQPRVGIGVMAVAFGLQHLAFSPSWQAAVVYGVAFLLWGTVAGLIYRRQRRLVPLIVAHFLTNAPFGVLPFVFALST
jgi:membrane protease YdiL (CAAX protease family)